MISGILTQSCSARAKNFTKCVFYHVQFSGVIQNIAYHRAIFTLFVYVDYYQNNRFYLIKISFSKFCFYGTMIRNILDNTTYMIKYTFGEIFSLDGATLYKNPSDQTVSRKYYFKNAGSNFICSSPFMNCPCFLQFITSSAGNETNCVSQGKMGYIKQQTWGKAQVR